MNLNLDKIKAEIRSEWKMYAVTLVGTAILFAGWLFLLAHETGFAAAGIIAGGAIDIFIAARKLRTITQWIRYQFGIFTDRAILAAMLAATAVSVCLWNTPVTKYDALLLLAVGPVLWHLFANEGDSE